MDNLQHSWEQFCRTGLVSDYLAYRRAAEMNRARGAEEEFDHEDYDRRDRHPGAQFR